MIEWASHHITLLLVLYAAFSNVVATLPTPNMAGTEKSSRAYIVFWSVCHFVAMNLPRVFPILRVSGKDKPNGGS